MNNEQECWFCGKRTYMFLHSCTGVPKTPAAEARYMADREGYMAKLLTARSSKAAWPVVES